MSNKKPEFPKPSVGDELIIVRYATRYRVRAEIPVRVKAVARFRITLEGMDRERLPIEEFDLRTQLPWEPRYRDSEYNSRSPRLHTPETLGYERRADKADAYLRESRLHLWGLEGTLREAARADLIGFVNALRRFEGLEEI